MPPIFGILNTRMQAPDQELISRMQGAARYIKPRRIEAIEAPGAYMAAAVVIENPLVTGSDAMAVMGPWAIAADATLYKREELIRRMGKEGETQGDASLILEAYLRWGEKCLLYLYGDFVFVIFNQETGEVFCGRDPLGVRPFFYCKIHDSFIFGSELSYIVKTHSVGPLIRKEYLLNTLITAKLGKDQTAYAGISRLKPGHLLRYRGDNLQILPFWHIDPEEKIRLGKEEDYVDLFREKLMSAVKVRCKGVSNLGSELSGGLDSSAVCGIAASFCKQESYSFTAFSNIFPQGTEIEFNDEREFIASMVAFGPMNWVGIDRLGLKISELIEYANQIQGCFIQQNFSVFNHGIYKTACEKGIDVLLSGFGGDEVVSARIAIPWNEMIREGQWRAIRDELFFSGVTPKSLLKPFYLAAKYVASLLYQPVYKTGVISPELLEQRFTNLPLRREFAAEHLLKQSFSEEYRIPWHPPLAKRQLARIMQNHVPQRMEYCYAAAAQYGIEYRYPLLDEDLIRTYLSFPPWVKQHHGNNRYVFREAIRGFVPEEIRVRNDKSGATIPQTYYSLVNERETILALISNCSASAFLNEIFDFSRFAEWYDKLVKRDPGDVNNLMRGTFYTYLMILIYYRDEVKGTRDESRQ